MNAHETLTNNNEENTMSKIEYEVEFLKREIALLKCKDSLDECQRREMEEARETGRPPVFNPVYVACLEFADESAERVGFLDIEMAEVHCTPGYIFRVRTMDERALKVLSGMVHEGWNLSRKPEDFSRPFLQENSGPVTICAEIPSRCDAFEEYFNGWMGADSSNLYDWEKYYLYSYKVAYGCVPKKDAERKARIFA